MNERLVKAAIIVLLLFSGSAGGISAHYSNSLNDKLDILREDLATVTIATEKNTTILAEVRDDVLLLVKRQEMADDRYVQLFGRVVKLEGQLSALKEIVDKLNGGK